MAYNSFDALVSSVQAVQEDNDQDFINYIPTAIQIASDRLRKELDGTVFQTNAEITCVTGQRTLLKPTGYRFSYNAFLYNPATGKETLLIHQPDDFLRVYWDSPSSVGQPKYYATDNDQLNYLLAPTPDSSTYLFRANIQADLATLSATNQTNFLTQFYGQELFFATMSEQMAFSKDLDKKQMWEASYINAVMGANNESARERLPDGETKDSSDSQDILRAGQADKTS